MDWSAVIVILAVIQLDETLLLHPYIFQVCNKKFSRKTHLKRHSKVHSKVTRSSPLSFGAGDLAQYY